MFYIEALSNESTEKVAMKQCNLVKSSFLSSCKTAKNIGLIGQIICSTNLYVTCRKEGYIFSLRQTFYYSCYGAMQISLFQSGLTLLIYATEINDHSSDSAAKKTNF